jgi:hypothetical protein
MPMKAKARFRKYLVRGFAAALVSVAAGYLSAWLSLSQCQTMTQQALAKSNLKSYNFSGDIITYKDVKVRSEVTFPFIVESYYWAPLGMHATYYEYKYFAFFGFVRQYGYIRYSIV